ncbi:MAG TPA: aminotransferase class I/II-fold pyridoxal phosphate-dependent enzyme [Bacteroidales bacterium]|jgi:aminotransferase in exopolysaccharide biosynthesis|nr:aminotransferase class I/II-fold pyridoxal phosphate-dependent enzyme [Bacteroidales bacterium]HOS71759.1 aminotransferase class I/II-fold pyridoxal phosphate-dependent enzyme [Bacteroidales bacterium]HQH25374.1 aminotransferase class I/II-fold pyridoxal phosphate-dependent enzyme [Bacteroidales bacterium]HQJ82958.1 aminotransferase class I/II-fold pyridoxal phosphate-dependent enzyme [Bacteroidales bacterium]
MNKKRIYLSSPHMGGTEEKYVGEAFSSNWIAPLGPNVDAFEKSVAEYCGIEHAVALSSGTAAIHLALIMLGIKAGDEVMASTFTFSATVNPITYVGAIPVLIDSEPGTWNMDPGLLEQAILERSSGNSKRKIKAIIVVHLYGMPANMDRITEIAARYEIPLIEDAAEALGSRFSGIQTGTFGKMGILSFNGNKIITTSGGGALICNDKGLADRARFLSTQARDNAPHYQHSQIGYNYRMSNVLAGIGIGQMEVLEERVKARRNNHFFYKKNLEKFEEISFLNEPGESYFSNFWLTTILIDPARTRVTREELQTALENENIESRPLWKPMHLQPVFSSCPVYQTGVSEDFFNRGLCLPSGSNLTDDDRERIMNVITKTLSRGRR